MKARISSRSLLDLLAGRITPTQFAHNNGLKPNEPNIFQHWLNMGLTIQGAEFETKAPDEDDDFLVLTFSDDPSARGLKPLFCGQGTNTGSAPTRRVISA